ncbi:hypothetical protein BU064_13435 [Staphylococcus succinus]|nr:hypothetical protein BU064_13435 [Staphylococcus succinus]
MNKLEQSSLLFIIFVFLSSLTLLYFKYNFTFLMPILIISILTIIVILTVVISLILVYDEDT